MASPRNTPRDPALRLLAERLGSDEIVIVSDQTQTSPDGTPLRSVHAAVAGRPNETAHVVIRADGDGGEVDLAALEARAGRRVFQPDVGGVGLLPIRREPVTIDPAFNDLVLAECTRFDERITVTIPISGTNPKADVYLLADTTGSMEAVLDAVKAGAAAIVGNTALAAYDVAYGVGNYRDFPVGAAGYAFEHQQSPTNALVDVQNAINLWNAADGNDTPEAQLWALEQIATDPAIGWRPDAKRIVVWFGDAPGHDPICAAISGGATDVTEGSATAALQAAAITVVSVSTTTGVAGGLDGDPTIGAIDYVGCIPGGAPGQATRISAATGGSATAGVDATMIVSTLSALIAAAVTSTGNVSLVASPSIAGFITGIWPGGGYGPLPGDVPHTLGFDVSWAGTVDCADDPQVFTGTIDAVADGVVVASKIVRITVPPCRYHHVVEMLCGLQSEETAECLTVVAGRYATAVTIYNPGPCPVVVEKSFAPVLLNGKPIGREPDTVPARPFAKVELAPGEATMDDCCALAEAVRLDPGSPTLGVLDLTSDHPLIVTAIHTSTDAHGRAGAVVHTRTIAPHRC